MIRIALAASMIALASGSALGQADPANEPAGQVTASGIGCAELGALVARQGALVVRTGQFGYERVVRDQEFCGRERVTAPMTVETRDSRSCFAGYRCRERNYGEGRTQ